MKTSEFASYDIGSATSLARYDSSNGGEFHQLKPNMDPKKSKLAASIFCTRKPGILTRQNDAIQIVICSQDSFHSLCFFVTNRLLYCQLLPLHLANHVSLAHTVCHRNKTGLQPHLGHIHPHSYQVRFLSYFFIHLLKNT